MIQWMAARGVARTWWPALVGAAVIAGPVFLLGHCSGVQAQKDRDVAASVSTVKRVGEANTTAAGERAEDNHRITSAQEEQSHAIQSAPDEKPGPGRLRRACVQLRQQGLERLPAVCE
ncbi:MAG TPA: hypothetical protein PLG07_14280, partial [Phenylobacterium sp.]|nr:hypothetical protein [Phenylobacterium sp.]